MTCTSCRLPADDNACAYYNVGKDAEVWKCWFCLAPHEKQELEQREAILATEAPRVFKKWKNTRIPL